MVSGKGEITFVEPVSYNKKTGELVEGIKVHCVVPYGDGSKVCVCWVSITNPVYSQIKICSSVYIRFGKYGEYIANVLE